MIVMRGRARRVPPSRNRTVIAALLAVATATLLSGCGPSALQRQAASEELARLKAAEAEGLQCVASLAERSPRRDAERDWAVAPSLPARWQWAFAVWVAS